MTRIQRIWIRSIAIFIIVLCSHAVFPAHGSATLHPLAPPLTRSPRATLTAFLNDSQRAYELLMAAQAQSRAEAGWTHSPAVLEQGKQAEILMNRAVRTINLKAIPAANSQRVGLESALMLKEILDRIDLPPADQIPGDAAVLADKTFDRWEIPETEIDLVKGQEGTYIEEFLFSPDTQKRTHSFYQKVKDLPYKEGASEGFYNFYIRTPGSLLPPKWSLWLPAWSTHVYAGQTLWQWLALILFGLLVVGVFATFKLLRRLHRIEPTQQRLTLIQLRDPCFWGFTILLLEYILYNVINITGNIYDVLSTGITGLLFLVSTWFVFLLVGIIAEWIIKAPWIEQQGIDASLIRTVFRLLAIMAAATVLYVGAQELGIPVAPLLASFGALTLAIGVGAQEYFKNVVGGLTLFIDRPVRVGELCEFGGILGTVEEIGLRSTRIRTLERTLVSVPNSSFSTSQLTNYSKRDQFELKFTLGLRYETTHAQMQQVLEATRNFLDAHPRMAPAPLITLAGLGDSSLNINVWGYLLTSSMTDFLVLQEEILLKMMQIVEQAGADFAFPSQTLYLSQDDSPPDVTSFAHEQESESALAVVR